MTPPQNFVRLVAITCVSVAAFAGPNRSDLLPLMPMPWKVTRGPGKLIVDSDFRIAVTSPSDNRVDAAAQRLLSRIARQTGLPIRPELSPTQDRASLVIECRGAGSEAEEAYKLDITPAAARLSASTWTGALHGMETFAQLISPGLDAFEVPEIHIEDKPRFPWRGLMIDAARHWMPVPVIERNLDGMAAVKLNTFHWHLSDDQGFRVESKLYPKLQQLGSDGDFYSQEDVRHIVAYAHERGIRVIPEFDMPGHTTAWFVGYPEFASAPGPYTIERKWGIFEPTLDPTREEVYQFLDALIGEMASLFPDPYFHIGGDEVKEDQWKASEAIQKFALAQGFKSSVELQAHFSKRVQALVKKHGKTVVGWDEVMQPGLASDTVIQSWRGQASLAEAARSGYRGILSFGYYLDHMRPASFHYGIDTLDGVAKELDAPLASRILGGEACMWSEYVNSETVESRIWPRVAVIAERLWSPRELKSVDSMYARLETVNRSLDWVGVQHRVNRSMLLERLTGGQPTGALTVLTDSVEPLGIHGRRTAQKYTSMVPLNRFVDAASPESESVRRMSEIAARLVAGPREHGQEINEARYTFTEWSLNDGRLRPILENNFLLKEIAPLSEDLTKTGRIGLRALEFLESGEKVPENWIAEQQQQLAEMEKPRAEVVLAAVRPVRTLLEGIRSVTFKATR